MSDSEKQPRQMNPDEFMARLEELNKLQRTDGKKKVYGLCCQVFNCGCP